MKFLSFLFSLSLKKRLQIVLQSVCVFFVVGMLLSWKLWFGGAVFPDAPWLVVPWIGDGSLLSWLMVAWLIVLFFVQKKRVIFWVLLAIGLLVLDDQMRLQPRVYTYILVLFPFLLCFHKKESERIRIVFVCLQVLLIGVYVWSWFHKLNDNFVFMVYPQIVDALVTFADPVMREVVIFWWYWIGVMELLLGLFLLFPSTRKRGVLLVLFMHCFILFYLSPLISWWNAVVYPWNLAMMVMVVMMFGGVDNHVLQKNISSLWYDRHYVLGLMIVFAWLLPFFHWWGARDAYVSFSLYSGKRTDLYVQVYDEDLRLLDPLLQRYLVGTKEQNEYALIDVFHRSIGELQVPVYPERRVFRHIADYFCDAIDPTRLKIYDYQRPKSIWNQEDFSHEYFCKK